MRKQQQKNAQLTKHDAFVYWSSSCAVCWWPIFRKLGTCSTTDALSPRTLLTENICESVHQILQHSPAEKNETKTAQLTKHDAFLYWSSSCAIGGGRQPGSLADATQDCSTSEDFSPRTVLTKNICRCVHHILQHFLTTMPFLTVSAMTYSWMASTAPQADSWWLGHVEPDDVVIADIAGQALDIFLHGPESAHKNGIGKTFTHTSIPIHHAHSKKMQKQQQQNAQLTKHDAFVYWTSSCAVCWWPIFRKLGTCSTTDALSPRTLLTENICESVQQILQHSTAEKKREKKTAQLTKYDAFLYWSSSCPICLADATQDCSTWEHFSPRTVLTKNICRCVHHILQHIPTTMPFLTVSAMTYSWMASTAPQADSWWLGHVEPDDVVIADIAGQALDIFLHGPESAHKNGIGKTFTHTSIPIHHAHSKKMQKQQQQNAQLTKHDAFVYWTSSCAVCWWPIFRKLGTCSTTDALSPRTLLTENICESVQQILQHSTAEKKREKKTAQLTKYDAFLYWSSSCPICLADATQDCSTWEHFSPRTVLTKNICRCVHHILQHIPTTMPFLTVSAMTYSWMASTAPQADSWWLGHVEPDDVVIADIAGQALDIFLHGPESAHKNGIGKTFTHTSIPIHPCTLLKKCKNNNSKMLNSPNMMPLFTGRLPVQCAGGWFSGSLAPAPRRTPCRLGHF